MSLVAIVDAFKRALVASDLGVKHRIHGMKNSLSNLHTFVDNRDAETFQLNIMDSPYGIYLHSLRPRLVAFLTLFYIKRYHKNFKMKRAIRLILSCLTVLNVYRTAQFGVLLYLKVLENKCLKLRGLRDTVLGNSFNDYLIGVLKGHIRQCIIKYGGFIVSDDTANDTWTNLIDVINTSILSPYGTLNIFYQTKILCLINEIDEIITFFEINMKHCDLYINSVDDWRLQEMYEMMLKMSANLSLGFDHFGIDLHSLVNRYNELKLSNNEIKHFNILKSPAIDSFSPVSSPTEKRKSSGFNFSLIKVINEDDNNNNTVIKNI